MPTISANVTKKELDTIREYANDCGETISNLIRKVFIQEAIFCKEGKERFHYRYYAYLVKKFSSFSKKFLKPITHYGLEQKSGYC